MSYTDKVSMILDTFTSKNTNNQCSYIVLNVSSCVTDIPGPQIKKKTSLALSHLRTFGELIFAEVGSELLH